MLIETILLGGGIAYAGTAKARKGVRRKAGAARRLRRAALVPGSKPEAPAGIAPGFSLKRFARDLKSAMGNEGTHDLKLDIDPEERARMERARREGKRNLLLSIGATGLAVLGTTWPVFSLLGAAAVLYLVRDMFRMVAKDFRRGHFLSMYLIGLVSLFGMIVTGQLVLAALLGVIGGFFTRIIRQVEEDSEQALVRVFGGHPERVWVLRDGVELEVDFHALAPGDLVVVNAGEVIPVDGTVDAGAGQVDQHLLTGESQPVERGPGEAVLAATLLLAGRLVVRVDTAGEETVAARIGRVLEDSRDYKYRLISRGRAIADRWLPLTAGLAALTWPLLGPRAAIAVLWANLGGPMGALGPLSVLSYLQLLSRRGILVKDGRVFELLRGVDTVVFDKTGTLTLEQPTVGRIHAFGAHDEADVLRAAATAEYRQPHPIARAILAAAAARGLDLPDLEAASYSVGYGIAVQVAGRDIRVGSARFLAREGIALPDALAPIRAQADRDSHSLVHVAIDGQLAGVIELLPTIRPEAAAVIAALQQRGLELYIISGDHEAPTRRMAERLGIAHYFAETLPEHKADRVKELRAAGRTVCFIGDGINDAIALKSAQVSISLKGASTAATDTAQIVFMDGTLAPLPDLLGFADDYERTMRTNLVASFAPGAVTITGVYLLHIGVGAAMAIFYLGALTGLGNTLLPLIRHQERDAMTKHGNPPSDGAAG
jgi:Cu2+-exporting ATPase